MHLEDYLLTLSYVHWRDFVAETTIFQWSPVVVLNSLVILQYVNYVMIWAMNFISCLYAHVLTKPVKKYIKRVLDQSQSALSFYKLINMKSTIELTNLCKYLQILMNEFKLFVAPPPIDITTGIIVIIIIITLCK